ncbi:MAG: hypothetical protein IPI77_08190 [Saprospiraceae bacterium]|nr:hypothetical protein [Saprospiraceae bacterium]
MYGCRSSLNPCSSNQSPTISITSSASSYPRNSSFTIDANANDPDGLVTKVELYNGTTLLTTVTSSPFILLINPASASNYSITAKVYDDCNSMVSSNALTINTTVSCTDGFQNGTETGVDCGGVVLHVPLHCTPSLIS